MKRFRMVALTLALVCFGFATAFAGDPAAPTRLR